MTKRRWNLLQRHARWARRKNMERAMAAEVYGDDDLGFTDRDGVEINVDHPKYGRMLLHYRDWLMVNATKTGRGSRMRRALIRAEQRYNALKRDHLGISCIRRSYPARWR